MILKCASTAGRTICNMQIINVEVTKWNDIENLLTNGKKMSQQQKLTQQQTGCGNLKLLKLSVEDALLCHSDLVHGLGF